MSQIKRLNAPNLVDTIAGTFKKAAMDPCDKLILH